MLGTIEHAGDCGNFGCRERREYMAQEVWRDNRQAEEVVTPYAAGWEHMADELRRLDLLIRLCLLHREQSEPPAGLLEQFRGLVLSDEEIARLLADPPGWHVDDAHADHRHREHQE